MAEEEAVDFEQGDSLVVDMSGVEEASFEAIPAGRYPCQIVECEFGYSKAKGTPMWTMQIEISDGEHAGRKLFVHWVWGGKGLGFTKKDLAQVAPELIESPFDVQDVDIISSMLGKDVIAKVTLGLYEGEKNNSVRGLFAAGDGGGFG